MGIFDNFRKKPSFKLNGGQGVISARLTLPEAFDCAADKCPLVILMHGFMAKKDMNPIKFFEKELPAKGIATLSFDFNGHGKSGGSFSDMTVLNELDDARVVWDYAKSLPYVTSIGLLGHSQGGVVSGMLSGALTAEGADVLPAFLVQLASAAVLHDDALNGDIMGKKFDPANPPEILNVFFHKLGRGYIQVAQKLDIYGATCGFAGPVCLIHGTLDRIVPVRYSEEYHRLYPNSELHLIEGETHLMNKKPETMETAVQFIVSQCS